MPKKKTGQKVSLSDFQGTGYNQDALPTGPAEWRPDRDQRGDRNESGFRSNRGGDDRGGRGGGDDRWGGGGRGGYDEDDNSRADDSGDWRTVRRPQGGGGGSRFGGSNDRYGGDRWGGSGDRYGDSGGSSGYKRLNLSRKGEEPSSQDLRGPSREARFNNKQEQEKKEKATAERKFALDDVATVAVEDKLSALQKALTTNTEVSADELAAGLGGLTLEEKTEKQDLVECIAKSVLNSNITLKQLVDTITKSRPEEGAKIIMSTLKSLKRKQGEVDFVKSVRAAGDVDFPAAIAPGLKDAELDEFLEKNKLIALKPVPDLSSFVEKAFEDGKSAEHVLKHISDTVSNNICVSELTTILAKTTSAKVFAEKSKPNLKVIEEFSPLLVRVMCRPDDFDAQKLFLFTLQEAWFNAGKGKGVMKELFVALYDNGVVAVEAFNLWKDDTKSKAKGKMPALLQVNSWLEEIQPVEHEGDEDDEGDEGDDEDVDYVAAPTKEYF